MRSSENRRGLFASLCDVAGGFIALLATRVELVANELEEERLHLASLALHAALAMFLLMMGTVFAGLLLVLLLWDGPREWALGGLSAGFLLGGAVAAGAWRRKAMAKPPLLHMTRSNFRRDAQALDQLGKRRFP